MFKTSIKVGFVRKKFNWYETTILLGTYITAFVYYILPLIIFKTDCVIPAHDNLDSVNSWLEMFRQNNLFFSVDAPTPCFLGITASNFGYISFSFQSLLFFLFDNFTAYSVNYILSFFVSIFCMIVLLEYVVKENTFMNLMVAAIYAILPVIPSYHIAIATLPLILYILLRIYNGSSEFNKHTLWLVLFPFFSLLVGVGVFVLGIWALAIILYFIKKKKVSLNLCCGFLCLTIGYILVEFRIIYSVFIIREPSNRSILSNSTADFYERFCDYFISGWYHIGTMQEKIVLPFLLLSALIWGVVSIAKWRKESGQTTMIKNYFDKDFLVMCSMVMAAALCSVIGVIHDAGLLENMIEEIVPFLKGFNWGRFWILNRVFWYVAFAIALKKLYCLPLVKLFAIAVVCLQLMFIATDTKWNSTYNYAAKTWINEIILKPRGIQRDEYISYNEFYSPELFEKIKEDIDYKGENVVALGYHPSVLMYNGYSCVDGYLNSYRLSYMKKFRTLIEPELNITPKTKDYFDSWGGRMYLYNEEVPYAPTWNRVTVPVTLNVDPVVMRADFDIKYILSRAEIGNTAQLGLKSIAEFDDKFYKIWVYSVEPQ